MPEQVVEITFANPGRGDLAALMRRAEALALAGFSVRFTGGAEMPAVALKATRPEFAAERRLLELVNQTLKHLVAYRAVTGAPAPAPGGDRLEAAVLSAADMAAVLAGEVSGENLTASPAADKARGSEGSL